MPDKNSIEKPKSNEKFITICYYAFPVDFILCLIFLKLENWLGIIFFFLLIAIGIIIAILSKKEKNKQMKLKKDEEQIKKILTIIPTILKSSKTNIYLNISDISKLSGVSDTKLIILILKELFSMGKLHGTLDNDSETVEFEAENNNNVDFNTKEILDQLDLLFQNWQEKPQEKKV